MAIQLGNIVNTITQEQLFPVVVDNFYEGNVLFMRLRGKKKNWTTGRRLLIATELLGRNNVGSYAGFDTFNTTQEDVRQQFVIDPVQYHADVAISGIQVAANKGKEGIIDLLTTEMMSIGKALPDLMGQHMYLDGTGNNNKNITGLQAHVDDSTNVVTYQGLSRTAFPRLQSTLTAQVGSFSLADIAADYDAAQISNDAPDLFLTTPAIFTIFEALLTPTVQHNMPNQRMRMTAAGLETGGIAGNQGFSALTFRGVPFVSDDKCTSGNLYTLNTNYLDLYELEPDGHFVNGTREGFGWTGWKRSLNQDAIVSNLIWYGQLVGTQPRKQARRTGITS